MTTTDALIVFPIIGILCILTAFLVWEWLDFHSVEVVWAISVGIEKIQKRWRSLIGRCDCEFCTLRRDYERTNR